MLENRETAQSFIVCAFGKQDRDGISLIEYKTSTHHFLGHAAEDLIWEELLLLPEENNHLAFLSSEVTVACLVFFMGPEDRSRQWRISERRGRQRHTQQQHHSQAQRPHIPFPPEDKAGVLRNQLLLRIISTHCLLCPCIHPPRHYCLTP